LSGEASQASGSAHRAQTSATITWIQRSFLPYLSQLKAITQKR
jgi:hypothetical protein